MASRAMSASNRVCAVKYDRGRRRNPDETTGALWHITRQRDFAIDPNFRPLLAYGAGRPTPTPSLFLTDSPRYWLSYFGDDELWAVRVRPSPSLKSGPLGGHPEWVDTDPARAKVLEVLRLEDAIEAYPGVFGGPMDWFWIDRPTGFDGYGEPVGWERLRRPGFLRADVVQRRRRGVAYTAVRASGELSVVAESEGDEVGRAYFPRVRSGDISATCTADLVAVQAISGSRSARLANLYARPTLTVAAFLLEEAVRLAGRHGESIVAGDDVLTQRSEAEAWALLAEAPGIVVIGCAAGVITKPLPQRPASTKRRRQKAR